MPTLEFLHQPHPTRPRIYAVGHRRQITAIATLENANQRTLDQLMERMNNALASGDTQPILEASAGLPEQVRRALINAIPQRPHDWWAPADLWGRAERAEEGRVHVVGDDELADLLQAVDVLDCGLRAVNYRGRWTADDDPDVVFGWVAHIRQHPGTCFAGGVERAWPLPEGLTPVMEIPSSPETVADDALELAASGHLVRISTALIDADWTEDYTGDLAFFIEAFNRPLPSLMDGRAEVQRYAVKGW